MKTLAVLCLAAVFVPAAVTSSPPASVLAPGKYSIDPVHSTVLFRIEHFGVSQFFGRFNSVTGDFTLAEKPEDSSLKIEIKTGSVDTADEGRDRHLRSPDFFNAKQFPTITFTSSGVRKGAEDKIWEVSGVLSLHGEERPITVQLEQIGAGETMRGDYRTGFGAVFQIRRSDFGMKAYLDNGALGDVITIFVGVEGIRN